MRIAVLALQGAFIEHRAMLARLGVETFEVRQLADWRGMAPAWGGEGDGAGIILPGGESTVQARLLRELSLWKPLQQALDGGLPALGTCAGMILLAEGRLATMDIRVRRNAYGRQLGSFHAMGHVDGIGDGVPMTFIRAPYVEAILSPRCQPIAETGGHVVAVRQGRQIATAFHPELDSDTRLHAAFLQEASSAL